MKKAFLQVIVLIVFANAAMMISAYTKKVPKGYHESRAVIMFENFETRKFGLGIDVGENLAMFTEHGAVDTYLFSDIGDFVTVHYQINESRSIILDAYITNWNLVPFTIDKIILEFFASIFLFGLLTRKERMRTGF